MSRTIARESVIPEIIAPWSILRLKKIQILDDKAQNKEARENIRMLPNKTGLRPNLSESGHKITCRMAVIAR